MTSARPLYFSDFLSIHDCERCEGCDTIQASEDMQNIQLDEPGCWARRCGACVENQAWD